MSDFQIQWRGPVVNGWPGRNGHVIEAIVNHIMAGTIEASDGWFHNPASQVSAHFGIAKDGRVYQWVPQEDTAWANGILQAPDTSVPLIAEWVNGGFNPNNFTLSIEHEGYPGDVMPEVQYQASLWLHKQLLATHNIPADRNHLLGHYQIMSRDRANCPGPSFPWQRLISDLNASPPPPPAPEFDPAKDFDADGGHYFSSTRFWVVDTLPDGTAIGFWQFWQKNGGLSIFGYPISGCFFDASKNLTVQWFERARFEWHPETNSVMLGLLGSEAQK